jgi:hypothetical protein
MMSGTPAGSGVVFYSTHDSQCGPSLIVPFLELNEIYIEKCRDVYNFRQRAIREQHLLTFTYSATLHTSTSAVIP